MQRCFSLLAVLLYLSACSTSQLVPSVYSVENPDETALGLAVHEREIFLEHMPEDNQQLVFDLEILNHSGGTVAFDPMEIRLFMSNKPFPEMTTDNQYMLAASHVNQTNGYSAIPPRTAGEVDSFIKRKIRSQRAAQIAFLVLGTAMVVSDVVQDANLASKEVITDKDIQRAQLRDVATSSALVAMDLAGAKMEMNIQQRHEDLEFLPEEFLSRQVLLSGSSARGKVYFKRHQPYAYYRLIIPVLGQGYVFDFRRPNGRERKMLRRYQSFY